MKKVYFLFNAVMIILLLSLVTINSANAQLYINEFMASNTEAFPGPENDYPDWIEVYNAGAEDVMLGGYYMADDLIDPEARYMIPDTYPDSVTVAAGGYILFYANKGQETSVLNLAFKLKGAGEAIGFWNTDGTTVVDTLTYGEQETDVSMGRYPDGTDEWFFMPDFTPGASNNPNAVADNGIEKEGLFVSNYPNPFTEETTIGFQVNEPGNVKITVYDLTGSVVQNLVNEYFNSGKHEVKWNNNNLPAGIYFYRLETSNSIIAGKATIVR